MTADHDPYAALRFVDYRRLLAGGVVASIGSEVQAVAVGWELYQRTESAWYLGWAGLGQFLPVLLLALPAGQAADRYDRRRQFQLAQAGTALASIGLAIVSLVQGPVDLILFLLLLSGVGRAFTAPARVSLLPQLIPQADLPNAVAWNSTGWQVANVSGPALGGFMLALTERPSDAYLFAACCAVVCITLIGGIRPPSLPRPRMERSLASLLAGLHFVGRSRFLLPAITLDLFAVLLGGAVALLPIFAKDILGVGPVGLGWLRAAPAIGAFIMAVSMAHRPPLRRPGMALLVAVAGFGLATIVFGLSDHFLLSFSMLLLTGAFDNVSVVVRGTLMQVLTPDSMRGRVAAVNTVFISSSNELGAFESGATAALFGPVLAVVGGGIGTLAIVILVYLAWPGLASLGPLHELKPEDTDSPTPCA